MSGIFGSLQSALGGLLGQAGGGEREAAGGLLQRAFEAAGGVPGILARMDQAGLGDKARSWVSAHQNNLPISPDEISRVFPPDQLDSWAQRFGLPAGAAAAVLAHLLPQAVDQSTPNGTVPDQASADTGLDAGTSSGGDAAPGQAPDLSSIMDQIFNKR
jgi:uncharacterized protein YidB (DUF937 family)